MRRVRAAGADGRGDSEIFLMQVTSRNSRKPVALRLPVPFRSAPSARFPQGPKECEGGFFEDWARLLRTRLPLARLLRASVRALLMLCCAVSTPQAQEQKADARPTSIRVVMDDNYPPFIFRDSSGKVQGILVDTWALWETRTGIAVNLQAMDWSKAQKVMQDGKADVIDTIFITEPRKAIYDFSAPYAKLEVPIFFHQSIGGIVNVDSLKGFTVGVKDGDACIDVLRKHGIEGMRVFTSYSAVVAAAGADDVRVFCMDKPPAMYLLHQLGIEKQFRHSVPLYTGEFHRAVRKGDSALLSLVEDGFRQIPDSEQKAIEQKWYGERLDGPGVTFYARYAAYAMLGVLLVAMVLAFWNQTLRRRVIAKTTELSNSVAALGMAKQATEQALAKLNATVDAIPDLLFEVGLDGRYYELHSGNVDFLPASVEDVVGKTVREILPADAAEVALAALQQANEIGVSRGMQMKLALASGIHWFELSVTRKSTDAGSEPRFIVISRDITERKNAETAHAALEAQLRESQKMQAIGTLAGGIAHDFNNIIATILGNVDLARLDLTNNPRALESLEEIRKAGSRARSLVQQILSFSRRQPTVRTPTALGPVIDESVRLLRATLPARLAIDVDCDTDVPAVLADATQIEQVIINLVTNAMQATPGSGSIRIRLDTVMLDKALADAQPALRALYEMHPGRTVRLVVSDDGTGMDAITLGRIFEPFFTTRAVDEGTGLGLSVVHGIVRTHEGAIVAASRPGRGTTITVYLPSSLTPAVALAHGEKAANHAVPGAGRGQHILYIDDDESLVFLVRRLIERRGLRISAYTDQREALVALRADPASFDLVVTDYNMPGMSGLDVAREVRAIRADLPVAVASGFIDEALRSQAGAAGVRELIFKASAVEDLCDAFVRLARSAGTQS